MTVYEIPLKPSANQQLTTTVNGKTYGLTLTFADVPDGGWYLDIDDQQGNPLLDGIALVTGVDLMQPYGYLGLDFMMWVQTDGIPAMVPDWNTLGTTSHLMVAY